MWENILRVFGQIHEENIFVTIVKNDLIMEVNEYNMVFSFSFSLNMLFSIDGIAKITISSSSIGIVHGRQLAK